MAHHAVTAIGAAVTAIGADRPASVGAIAGALALVDPVVLEASEPGVLREGCLSVPDLTANVRRPRRVLMRALDADGRRREHRMEGFEARAALASSTTSTAR